MIFKSTRQIRDLQRDINSLKGALALVADADRKRALEEDIVGRVWMNLICTRTTSDTHKILLLFWNGIHDDVRLHFVVLSISVG